MRGVYRLNPFLELIICSDDYSEELHGHIPCYDYRRKIIALRVYFALAVTNFLFIALSTSYYIYRNISANWFTTPSIEMKSPTNQNISRQWQIYSLKKRGLFGTVLGAIGHLMFSTTVLLYQVFVTTYTCDIYLWGPVVGFYIWTYAIIWRTFRLHYQIKMNELQQRYAKRKVTTISNTNSEKNDKSSSAKDSKEYIWFMNHKDNVTKTGRKQIIPLGVSFIVVLAIIIIAESLGIWINGNSSCEFYMGNYLSLAMVVFFFAIVVPFIFWYLRHDEDAHGIRKEIWVTMCVGVPCFIMCIIWQVLFEYPTDSKPAGLRGVFGPSNWLIIVTTTYHIMSVILPVFKTLSIDPQNQKHSTKKCGKLCRHRRSSIVSSHSIERALRSNRQNDSSTTIQNSIAISNHHWELTTESLHAILSDPVTLNILKNWAVKDFSIENILFYERYLLLLRLIRRPHQEQLNIAKNESLELMNNKSQDSLFSHSMTISKPTEEILRTPIDFHQIPELIDFYYTFIADQSPLQVNISHQARGQVDAALEPLAKKFKSNVSSVSQERTTKSGIPYFLKISIGSEQELDESYDFSISNNMECYKKTSDFSSTILFDTPNSKTKSLFLDEEKQKYLLSSVGMSSNVKEPGIIIANLTLEIFETARKEIFWNIFTGLFPKIVEAYNNQCSNNQCSI